MESTLPGKQHIAAVEAYTRQCMKSRAGATPGDDAGIQGRVAGSSRGAARACHGDEQFVTSELMNGLESRPNNLVCSAQEMIPRKLTFFNCVFLKNEIDKISVSLVLWIEIIIRNHFHCFHCVE